MLCMHTFLMSDRTIVSMDFIAALYVRMINVQYAVCMYVCMYVCIYISLRRLYRAPRNT
jgi:hypothetical protein